MTDYETVVEKMIEFLKKEETDADVFYMRYAASAHLGELQKLVSESTINET